MNFKFEHQQIKLSKSDFMNHYDHYYMGNKFLYFKITIPHYIYIHILVTIYLNWYV